MNQDSIEGIRVELESKIAFQEKAIGDLNDALVDHARTVIQLQRRIDLIEQSMRGLSHQLESFAERPPNEKPPHY